MSEQRERLAAEQPAQYVLTVKRPEAIRLPGGEAVANEPEADLAGALHEVSNALTVVLGWLEVAQARGAAGENISEALEVARTHAMLGHHVARRAIGGDVSPASAVEQPALRLAESAVRAVKPTADRRQIRVELHDEGADHVMIREAAAALQILTNLLLNGIDFSPNDTIVALSVSGTDEQVSFTVRDSGPGIEPQRIPTLFAGGDSTRAGGTGIGLRHSRALARSKSAELSLVESTPHAVFELTWPGRGLRSSTRPQFSPSARLAQARIFLVEDDPAVRSLLEFSLEARGAQVIVAPTAVEFARLAREAAPFDGALVDLSPIAEDVAGALAIMRGSSPNVRIILISGVASGFPDSIASEVSAWVRKPFEMTELIEALESALTSPARPRT